VDLYACSLSVRFPPRGRGPISRITASRITDSGTIEPRSALPINDLRNRSSDIACPRNSFPIQSLSPSLSLSLSLPVTLHQSRFGLISVKEFGERSNPASSLAIFSIFSHDPLSRPQEKTNAVKAFAREQCEAAAAQLQRQQQQLQHQPSSHQQSAHSQHQQHHHQQQSHHHHHHHHHQTAQQLQLRTTLTHAGSKIGSGGGGGGGGGGGPISHSTASLTQSGRGIHHSYQHQHTHHSHQQRHAASMSPSLLLSSPQPASQHNHSLTHRIVTAPTVATPPTTPGDRSPPSPSGGGGKLNRSQHLTRETSGSVSPGLPTATLDLSSAANTNSPHELSTLV